MNKFSLVIPCYNEGESIPELIRKCDTLVQLASIDVILVNNGSTDNTNEIFMKELNEREHISFVIVDENIGYGNGILSGLKVAKTEYVGWTHADLQTDPLDYISVIKIIEERGFPEKIYVKGKRYGRKVFDEIFTIGMSFFETILLKKLMWDINAQPNVFHRSLMDLWGTPPKDFSLDLFAYYTAIKYKYKVVRFGVPFLSRKHGLSHWNHDFSSKVKFIKRTLSYSFNLRKSLKKC